MYDNAIDSSGALTVTEICLMSKAQGQHIFVKISEKVQNAGSTDLNKCQESIWLVFRNWTSNIQYGPVNFPGPIGQYLKNIWWMTALTLQSNLS